jgi:hypothetical protein
MRVRIGGVLFFVALWCAGCASQPAAPIVAAVAPGQARISITRTDEGPSWSTAAKIEVNGSNVADLAPGQTYTGGVAPGPVSLTAKASVDIGFYTEKFNAVAGKTYAFQVSKRTEQVVAGVLGGVVGMSIDAAANSEKSGAFKITQVPP